MAVIEYKCPNCSGSLVFDAKKNKVVCEFCDSVFEPDAVSKDTTNQEAVHKSAVIDDEYLGDVKAEVYWQKVEAATKGYACPSCGGSIIGTEVSGSLFCPYCGNPAIIESNLSGEFKPDFVIPFKTTKEDAVNAFKKFCGKGTLLPSSFNVNAVVEKVTGIYVPYHLYSCMAHGNAKYKCTTVEEWEDDKNYYRKTDEYSVKRAGTISFANIPADASKSVDNAYMESIEPYRYDEMVPFDMSYLTGYLADKYDVQQEDCVEHLNSRVKNTVIDSLTGTVKGYDTTSLAGGECSTTDTTFSYALLPVWLMRIQYGEQYYYFAMNGQTGKSAGRLPTSKGKAAGYSAIIAAAVAILVLLIASGIGISGGAILVTLILCLITFLISFLTLKGKYKNVFNKNQAYDYKSSDLNLTFKRDDFVSTNTDIRKKPEPQKKE